MILFLRGEEDKNGQFNKVSYREWWYAQK